MAASAFFSTTPVTPVDLRHLCFSDPDVAAVAERILAAWPQPGMHAATEWATHDAVGRPQKGTP